MGQKDAETQLQMMWPERLRHASPAVLVPPGYKLRTYRPGDEDRFFQVMALAGWPGWNEEKLEPWRSRILPRGWVIAIHKQRDEIVATAMALRSEVCDSGGELGWLAADPDHSGKGLGRAVSAAVTARFTEAGCYPIHLFTEDWRLAAIKIYLKLGYLPYLYTEDMPERWQEICRQLQWPFRPEAWPS